MLMNFKNSLNRSSRHLVLCKKSVLKTFAKFTGKHQWSLFINYRIITLIIKQLTAIKTTVNPTNTLVTYNENSADKTTQNSDNVINKIIQINDKEPFKNKNKKMQTKI